LRFTMRMLLLFSGGRDQSGQRASKNVTLIYATKY
jgi:hypothetical protein